MSYALIRAGAAAVRADLSKIGTKWVEDPEIRASLNQIVKTLELMTDLIEELANERSGTPTPYHAPRYVAPPCNPWDPTQPPWQVTCSSDPSNSPGNAR